MTHQYLLQSTNFHPLEIVRSNRVHSEYVDKLQKQRDELYQLARKNDRESQARAKKLYDRNKKPVSIEEGEQVFVRREARSDGLETMFDGPFKVLQRQGVTVKLALRTSTKWVHLNRCKRYLKEDRVVTLPGNMPVSREGKREPKGENQELVVRENNEETAETETSEAEPDLLTGKESDVASPNGEKGNALERRHPQRQRKPNRKYTEQYWASRPPALKQSEDNMDPF